MDVEAEVRRRALGWVQKRHPEAVAVAAIEPSGSDWEGSTEGGFFSVFALHVSWIDSEGQRHTDYDVSGEDLEALWLQVMRDK